MPKRRRTTATATAHKKMPTADRLKAALAKRKKKYMTVFINGKQKRVSRPRQIEGIDIDEFIAHNADPIWLHQNGVWEHMAFDFDHAHLGGRTKLDRPNDSAQAVASEVIRMAQ